MSTHKHIDRICVAITVLSLLLTVLFMNGEALGITASSRSMAYEGSLFDTSRVHTIDIVIDDWDAFLDTATSEEYTVCSLVIDNKSVRNVAIRGKGNTSLSTVSSMGSQRYSFKIEFDHYESGKTYNGLDKLCLNNLIQDNTYMKDYLAYRLMAEFGADAPLCSYVWVTVNGEDWGLYLAVEAIEDSFLERVYNGEGDLYKPDSLSMGGGGPGNGMGFNIEDFINENAEAMGFPWGRTSEDEDEAEVAAVPDQGENTDAFPQFSGGSGSRPQMPGQGFGNSEGQSSQPSMPFGDGGMPFSMPGGMEMPDGMEIPDGAEMPDGFEKPGGMEMPGGMGGGADGGFGGMPSFGPGDKSDEDSQPGQGFPSQGSGFGGFSDMPSFGQSSDNGGFGTPPSFDQSSGNSDFGTPPSFGQGSENSGFGTPPSFDQSFGNSGFGDMSSFGNGSFQAPDMGSSDNQPTDTDTDSSKAPGADNETAPETGKENRDGAPGNFTPGGMPDMPFGSGSSKTTISWKPLILSAIVLAAGLTAAFLFKKRK